MEPRPGFRMGDDVPGRTGGPNGSQDVPLRLSGPPVTNCSAVVKDPADLIEKPLHLLGLHHSSAIAVAAVTGLVLGIGLILLVRRRILLR